MPYQENINIKKDSEEKSKMAIKVLDALVFEKLGIDYTLTTPRNVYNNKDNDNIKTPFNIDIRLDIDVDTMMKFSPTYDSKYESLMYDIEDRIEKALRYVSLQNYFGGVIFDYVNDTLAENELHKLQIKLISQIQFNFPDITEQQIIDAGLGFSFYYSESEQPYIRVELEGENIEEEPEKGVYVELVTCDELYNIMGDLFDRSPLSMSLEAESFLCHG
jgi:hypothetical protein